MINGKSSIRMLILSMLFVFVGYGQTTEITQPIACGSFGTLSFKGMPSGVYQIQIDSAGVPSKYQYRGTSGAGEFTINLLPGEYTISTKRNTATPGNTATFTNDIPNTTVIINTPTSCFLDSDGDGVVDHTDLDDDNDGILDSEESPIAKIVGGWDATLYKHAPDGNVPIEASEEAGTFKYNEFNSLDIQVFWNNFFLKSQTVLVMNHFHHH